MDISIIIVTYNTKQITSNCIESIFSKTTGVSFEVILIDNASTDGSKDFFEKDSRITYIYSNTNLGFGKANNLGYTKATGKYIFLLNSDTILVNNAIFEMYQYMEGAPKSVGCIGAVLLDSNEQIAGGYAKKLPTLNWIFQENMLFTIPKFSAIYNPYKKRLKNILKDKYPLEADFISGADMFIRRETIENSGLFDPDFFLYYEETEMLYRFHKNGYKSMVIDTPKIIHLEGGSQTKAFSLKRLNLNLTSRYLYAKKTFSKKQYLIFRLMHVLIIPRILLFRMPWKDKLQTLKTIFG